MEQIGANLVHQAGVKGEGVHIAILDTGINSQHPSLPNLRDGKAIHQCNNADCNTEWDDDLGHGTACAGVAAAADNGEYVTGVAPDATVHAIKANNENGLFSFSDTAAGIKWVADQGYDVLNMSFGGPYPSREQEEAIEYAYDNGVLLVAAAGNNGECSDCVGYPAAHDEVIAVSATTWIDHLASFSSTGPEIELAAPGQYIRTLDPIPGLAVFWTNGTSVAAPHVAGAGALLMAQGYSNEEARQRLQETAADIGYSKYEQGHGRLDVEAAVIGKGIKQLQLVNVDENPDGSNSDFNIAISANTMLEDYDVLSVGDPFFEVKINGESIVATEQVESSVRYQDTVEIRKDDLEQFESGEITITVILWEGDVSDDTKVDEHSLLVDYNPDSTTPTSSTPTSKTPTSVSDTPTTDTPTSMRNTPTSDAPMSDTPTPVSDTPTPTPDTPTHTPATPITDTPTPGTPASDIPTPTTGALDTPSPVTATDSTGTDAVGPGFGWLAALGGLGGITAHLHSHLDDEDTG